MRAGRRPALYARAGGGDGRAQGLFGRRADVRVEDVWGVQTGMEGRGRARAGGGVGVDSGVVWASRRGCGVSGAWGGVDRGDGSGCRR